MDFSFITDLVGNVASGGVFGLLGSVLGVGTKWLQRKQEIEAKKQEHNQKLELIDAQMKVSSQEGSWAGMTASQASETAINQKDTYKWVVAAKSLFRPVLTVLLWVMGAILFSSIIEGSLREWMADGEVTELVNYMVYSTFFCATTATTWWFGDRALNPPSIKNR